MPPRLSLLHVEDDVLWQSSVAAAVRDLPEVNGYETVATAAAALDRVAALRPGIVLLDIVLSDGDGLQVARQMARREPNLRVILLSIRRDDAVLQATTEAHIASLLRKTGGVLAKLPDAIRTVARGERYFPPDVLEDLRRFRANPHACFKLLSDRELQLLPHFGGGASDHEIAAAFHLSLPTVKSHRQNILSKLDLRSTARLVHWVIQHGFVRLPSDGWVARSDRK